MEPQDGCHPRLKDSDLDRHEADGWRIDGPLSVKLVRKNGAAVEELRPAKPVLGQVVERKVRRPGAPAVPPKSSPVEAASVPGTPEEQMKAEIDQENKIGLESMTLGEIQEMQASIEAQLSPETVAFLRRRHQQ